MISKGALGQKSLGPNQLLRPIVHVAAYVRTRVFTLVMYLLGLINLIEAPRDLSYLGLQSTSKITVNKDSRPRNGFAKNGKLRNRVSG